MRITHRDLSLLKLIVSLGLNIYAATAVQNVGLHCKARGLIRFGEMHRNQRCFVDDLGELGHIVVSIVKDLVLCGLSKYLIEARLIFWHSLVM
jgi:hypothetical protein